LIYCSPDPETQHAELAQISKAARDLLKENNMNFAERLG
jgi:hypothetical protein